MLSAGQTFVWYSTSECVRGSNFCMVQHKCVRGSKFCMVQHKCVRGSNFCMVQHKCVRGSNFCMVQHKCVGGSNFCIVQHKCVRGSNFCMVQHKCVRGSNFCMVQRKCCPRVKLLYGYYSTVWCTVFGYDVLYCTHCAATVLYLVFENSNRKRSRVPRSGTYCVYKSSPRGHSTSSGITT